MRAVARRAETVSGRVQAVVGGSATGADQRLVRELRQLMLEARRAADVLDRAGIGR